MDKNIFKVNNETDFIKLLDENMNRLITVLYVFSWCRHNKSAKSVVVNLAKEYNDVLFLYVDIATYEEEKLTFVSDLVGTPNFMFLFNDDKLDEYHGSNLENLKMEINKKKEQIKTIGNNNKDDFHFHKNVISQYRSKKNKQQVKHQCHESEHELDDEEQQQVNPNVLALMQQKMMMALMQRKMMMALMQQKLPQQNVNPLMMALMQQQKIVQQNREMTQQDTAKAQLAYLLQQKIAIQQRQQCEQKMGT